MTKKEKQRQLRDTFRPSFEISSQMKADSVVNGVIGDLKRNHYHSNGCFLSLIHKCPYNEQCFYYGYDSCPESICELRLNKDYYNSESYHTLERLDKLIKSYI